MNDISREKTFLKLKISLGGFPGGAVVRNPPANAGDTGSCPVREESTCRAAARPVSHNY